MNKLAYILIALPILLAGMRLITGKYIYSALTTLACMIIVLLSGARGCEWAAAGLAFSIIGDFYMNRERGFLYGILGFFAAHGCFLGCTLKYAGPFTYISGAVAVLLVVSYAIFLAVRVYPREPKLPVKIALSAYMLISVAVFALSLCARPAGIHSAVFSSGIFMIMFSDTLIGLGKYADSEWSRKWVLPTYYMCHILMALSFVFRMQ